MPSRAHSSVTRRTLVTPARCPSMRGRPRCRAHRPLPSMMTAMCRGSLSRGTSGSSSVVGTFAGRLGLVVRVQGFSRGLANANPLPDLSPTLQKSSAGDPVRRTPPPPAGPTIRPIRSRYVRALAGKSSRDRAPLVSCCQPGHVSYTGTTRRRSSTWPGKSRDPPAVQLVGRADFQLRQLVQNVQQHDGQRRPRRSGGPCSGRPRRRTSRSAAAGASPCHIRCRGGGCARRSRCPARWGTGRRRPASRRP